MSVINTTLPPVTSYLVPSQEMLASSLSRLSSGSLVDNPPDNVSGLAASDDPAALNRRALAATTGVQNAVSSLQTADAFLGGVEKILSRMGELAGGANTPAANSTDIASAQTEFQSLQDILRATIGGNAPGAFNGNADPDSVASGSPVAIPQPDLQRAALQGMVSQNSSGGYDLNATTPDAMTRIADALQSVAAQRVTLGAAQSQLQLAAVKQMIGQVNLGAVIPRISNAGDADASAQLAKYSILTQSSTALQAQANLAPAAVLRLL